MKVQDFISIAGAGDRPDIHTLGVNPALVYVPAGRQAEAPSVIRCSRASLKRAAQMLT